MADKGIDTGYVATASNSGWIAALKRASFEMAFGAEVLAELIEAVVYGTAVGKG